MTPYWANDVATVYHGDALVVMPTLPPASVDLILTDPPFFRVKGEWWDRQWDSADGFLDWLGRLCQEWRRVLKPNGSLYCFASPRMAARVEVEIGKWFNVLNRITWRKPPFGTKAEMFDKDTMRAFFPASEAIIFAEQQMGPTVDYLRQECEAAGLTPEKLSGVLGFKETNGSIAPRRYLSANGFAPIAREHWAALQERTGRFLEDYDSVYRPFNGSPDAPYTDVWDFPTVQDYPGKHPCEKPLAMMHHIISVSTRPGAVVLDPTCGSGSSLVAAAEAGRQSIGIDVEERWCRRSAHRLSQPVLNF